jgi:hypothetical protein
MLMNVGVSNSGNYRATVSNETGVVTSDSATLRVLASPRIVSITRSNGLVTISFESVAGLRYSLQSRSNVNSGPWSLVPGAIKLNGTGHPVTLTDSASSGMRFYQILVE